MAPFGAIPVSALAPIVAMPDHDPITVVMAPTLVPATIVMPLVMMSALDDDLLGIGNGRRRDSDSSDSGNSVSKLLHGVLLH